MISMKLEEKKQKTSQYEKNISTIVPKKQKEMPCRDA